jgi:DNA-directed RNA polymerase subunit RPC12/RpoP
MAFCYLEQDSNGKIQCPYCAGKAGVREWNTEYGDPLPGDTDVVCPHCSKEFVIETQIDVSYTARIAR